MLAARLATDEPFRSERFDVRAPVLDGPNDYWHEMNPLWDSDVTLVNVEHDMQFSDELIAELLDCPHPVCTHTYRVGPAAYGLQYAHDISLVGWHPPIEPLSQYSARGSRWVEPGDEFADFSGIGFVKIDRAARCAPLREDSWRGVEISVNRAINARWHLHWGSGGVGIKHYHYE